MLTTVPDVDIRAVLDAKVVYEAVLHGLAQQQAGRVGLSTPASLRTHVPDGHDTVLQAKGAYLLDDQLAGFRIGGIRNEDSVDEGRLILLYDLATLLPLALLEERTIYQLRVGAEIAATVAHLRPDGARRLVVIGSGRLAKAALTVINAVTPFEETVVCSRTEAKRQALVGDVAATTSGSLTASGDVEAACSGADVVLTITTATTPVLRSGWCRDVTLVISAGSGLECDPELYARADRLIVDDWEQCLTIGDLHALAASGDVVEDDVDARLCDLVTGTVPSGSRRGELVMAVPQGLTFLDLVVARRALDVLARNS